MRLSFRCFLGFSWDDDILAVVIVYEAMDWQFSML